MGRGWINPIKAENAQKRGAIFTKIAKEIQVATRLFGPDPEGNPRLRQALELAKRHRMPQDTIERAIKKGSGVLDGQNIEEVTYEAVGPFGIGWVIECQTDNRTRTVSELRLLFKKHHGQLGEGAASLWMFDRKMLFEVPIPPQSDPETLAIEVEADDLEPWEDGIWAFWVHLDKADEVRRNLLEKGLTIHQSYPGYRPKNPLELTPDQWQVFTELYDHLEDHPDTHRFYTTVKWPQKY